MKCHKIYNLNIIPTSAMESNSKTRVVEKIFKEQRLKNFLDKWFRYLLDTQPLKNTSTCKLHLGFANYRRCRTKVVPPMLNTVHIVTCFIETANQ